MEKTSPEIEGINLEAIEPMCHEARQKTWQAIEDIRSMLTPGITEKEAIKKANQLFASKGVRKFWHQTHIRFGKSTVKSFKDSYDDNIVLQENDIFFIDIGPVWNGIEGDCGKTFVLGDDPQKLKIASDVEVLFNDVREYWQQKKAPGKDLLNYAETCTEKMGYVLHPSYVKGHRLSEFSHFLYSKSALYDLEAVPSSARWVLEFQICDKSMQYGAFYEDLLLLE